MAVVRCPRRPPGLATLADLYDAPTSCPQPSAAPTTAGYSTVLAVDRLYRLTPFASERERMEHLFALYEKMRAPLEAGMRDEGEAKTEKLSGKDPCCRKRRSLAWR